MARNFIQQAVGVLRGWARTHTKIAEDLEKANGLETKSDAYGHRLIATALEGGAQDLLESIGNRKLELEQATDIAKLLKGVGAERKES